jgi:HEPN domain-containing protein
VLRAGDGYDLMTRRELQQLARIRLREAGILLRVRQYDGAYYLSGYAVECALKACIAKRTRRFEFPDRQTVENSWTHDPAKLLRTAGLGPALDAAMQVDKILERYWATVKDWKETSRYERRSSAEAQALYQAISDNQHGVLQWLQQHW